MPSGFYVRSPPESRVSLGRGFGANSFPNKPPAVRGTNRLSLAHSVRAPALSVFLGPYWFCPFLFCIFLSFIVLGEDGASDVPGRSGGNVPGLTSFLVFGAASFCPRSPMCRR